MEDKAQTNQVQTASMSRTKAPQKVEVVVANSSSGAEVNILGELYPLEKEFVEKEYLIFTSSKDREKIKKIIDDNLESFKQTDIKFQKMLGAEIKDLSEINSNNTSIYGSVFGSFGSRFGGKKKKKSNKKTKKKKRATKNKTR